MRPYGNLNYDNGLQIVGRPVRVSGYDRLAAAIVYRAVNDYQQALAPLGTGVDQKRRRKAKSSLREECEQFFYGSWYESLCDIQPDKIINKALQKHRAKVVRRYPKLITHLRKVRAKRRRELALDDWQLKEIRKARRVRVQRQIATARDITHNA